ncbi:hypothetical protein V1514DRAFT_195629 [Lipomyces japonicus]|uniref:uncharacterized protein n=1 Tax=Lipomyces japonicus TaxID=56871 RepID=UPI0034CE0757
MSTGRSRPSMPSSSPVIHVKEFVEPAPVVPTTGIGGFALGVLPPASKLRRSRPKKSSRIPSTTNSPPPSSSNLTSKKRESPSEDTDMDESIQEIEELDQQDHQQLQEEKYKKSFKIILSRESFVRPHHDHDDNNRINDDNDNDNDSDDIQNTDKRPRSRQGPLTTPPPESELSTRRKRRQKRVKISPIKKQHDLNKFGFGVPVDLSGIARSTTALSTNTYSTSATAVTATGTQAEDDPTKYNDDFCSACGGMGMFLCCEGCPRSFHFTCVDPPYDSSNLPDGAWYCRSCYARRHPPALPHRGLFTELLFQLESRNPVCFILPKQLRERFEGVTTTDFGEYQDINDLKPRKMNRSGFIEEADPYRLTDKSGGTILCYRCGKSSLDERPIASCDYCSLHWHLDCVDPPMNTMPSGNRKWMCPNHVGRDLTKLRRKKNSKIVNVSLRRGFVNNGDIEVGNDSSDDENDGAPPSIVKPSKLHFISGWDAPTASYGSAFDHRRIFRSEDAVDIDGVVYKLPERGIVLDFLEKVNLLSPSSYRQSPTAHYHEYNQPRLSDLDRLVERSAEEREFVRNITYLQRANTDEYVERQNISALLDAIIKPVSISSSSASSLSTSSLSSSLSSPDVPASSTNSTLDFTEDYGIRTGGSIIIDDKEKEQLLAIQKLIAIKGKQALLKFLNSPN